MEYPAVKNLLFKCCHRVRAQHRLPFDELLSEAHLAYVLALRTYDPANGTKPTTWIQEKVWWALLEYARQECRRPSQLEFDRVEPPKLDVEQLETDLSSDATTCVRTALDPPVDVLLGTGQALGMRYALVNYLLGLGWSGSRIEEAFREVRGAIE